MKANTKKRRFVVFTFVLPVAVIFFIVGVLYEQPISAFFARAFYKSRVHSVVLTASGFSPAELTISQGDTVVFSTNTSKHFWPASDLHPTHTIYPEFDPKQPIDTDKSWSFRFDKAGEWRFHDHLAPLYRGVVRVAPANILMVATDTNKTVAECHELSDTSAKQTCWKETLISALESQGIAASFDIFAAFYNNEPDFAENCHPFTHLIGEAAYEKFSKKEDFDISPQVAYCSYGFYHGFMEAMVQKTGKSEGAREFCNYIDKQLSGRAGSIGTADACFHGIGHGVTDGSDPQMRGDVFATINPGLALCEKVGKNEREIKLCGTGVFNALSSLYLRPEYKLDRSDPFWICRQQVKPYFKHACYDDLKTLIMSLADNNFAKAINFYNDIAENMYAADGIDNLATFAGYSILRNNTIEDAINTCQRAQKRLQIPCIRGLGAGFMTAGAPDEEYKKALGEVCGNPLLNEEERVGCFDRVLWASYARYPQEKHREICATVPEKYRYHCDAS